MDPVHIVIAAITTGLNVLSWVVPGSSPWHLVVTGLITALGGLSAFIAAHQSGSTSPVLSTNSSSLHVGPGPLTTGRLSAGSDRPPVSPLVPGGSIGAPQVVQRAPEQDQEGLP